MRRDRLDDLVVFESCQVGRGESQERPQDLFVVLAQERRGPDFCRRVRHVDCTAWHGEAAPGRMLDGRDHAALFEMFIG